MKRKCSFVLRLSEDEFVSLTAKARKAGCSREEFCRRILGGAVVREAPTSDAKELLRLMRRIGGNINQLLHRANTVGFIDTIQLRKDLVALREARQAIMLAYTGKRCTDNTQG